VRGKIAGGAHGWISTVSSCMSDLLAFFAPHWVRYVFPYFDTVPREVQLTGKIVEIKSDQNHSRGFGGVVDGFSKLEYRMHVLGS